MFNRNLHIWLPSFALSRAVRLFPPRRSRRPRHILFCIANHFEPAWGALPYEKEVQRVEAWVKRWPELASRHKDSDGRPPQHTFFYPLEEYRWEHLEKLAGLCRQGYGEVEIHLHHDGDTAEGLRAKLEEGKKKLASHGLLARDRVTGDIRYGFVHGNWALDNSRQDGRWCGVNNELQILRETGCYADFTLPSAPSDTQTRKINSIYYATDDPDRPKSHNRGVNVEVGKEPEGDLMIIQGVLGLNFEKRKYGLLPRVENCDINKMQLPTKDRIDLWVKSHIHVKGRPEWIFIKAHTHGAQERNWDVLLSEPFDHMLSYLEELYNDGEKYQLHYLTAREMYNIIKAAEQGLKGKPNLYRDFELVLTTPGLPGKTFKEE